MSLYCLLFILNVNILVLEGYLHQKSLYYPYKTSHKSIYLKYRRNADYDYEDWENNTSIYLPDIESLTTTTNSTHETTIIVAETTVSTVKENNNATNLTIPEDTTTNETNNAVTEVTFQNNYTSDDVTITNVTQFVNLTTTESITNATEADNKVNTTETTTQEVTDTTKVILFDETENLLHIFGSSTTVDTTTVVLPPPTLQTYFPGTTNDINDATEPFIMLTTTINPFLTEIKEFNKDGYFTASVVVLLKVLESKNTSHVREFLSAVDAQIEILKTDGNMRLFSGYPTEVFQSLLQMLLLEPDDVRHSHISYAIYSLENKKTMFKPDSRGLIDVVDTIYTESDAVDIAKFLKKLKAYPNDTDIKDLANEFLTSFVFGPFNKISGTARERLLIMEMYNVIQNKLHGQPIHRRKENYFYNSDAIQNIKRPIYPEKQIAYDNEETHAKTKPKLYRRNNKRNRKIITKQKSNYAKRHFIGKKIFQKFIDQDYEDDKISKSRS